jgi:hypothetical protein
VEIDIIFHADFGTYNMGLNLHEKIKVFHIIENTLNKKKSAAGADFFLN